MKSKLPLILTLLILALGTFVRLWKLDTLTSPYWEEVALGYDAYAILKTGKDHHGHSFPIVAFESFGDYKPSLYFYAAVPFIALFDLTVLAVRLPAALSGVAIILGVGQLIRLQENLTAKKKKPKTNLWLPILGMLITAVSPWAILFSRAAWEVNLATALILWGVNCYLFYLEQRIQQKKPTAIWLLVSGILLVFSMYTYHAARVIAPFLGVGLAMMTLSIYRTQLLQSKYRSLLIHHVVGGLVALVLLLPLLSSLGSTTLNHRFAETSIFSDINVIEASNQRKEFVGNAFLSRLFYHRYVLFGREIVQNLVSHFSPQFLFLQGDHNPRHSVQYFGQLYHLDAILLFFGLLFLVKRRQKSDWFLGWWLLVGIVPAAISEATPHALRILPTLPVWMIILTYGVKNLWEWLWPSWRKIVIGILVGLYVIEFIFFWRVYTAWYPQQYSAEWQYGYQQLVPMIQQQQAEHPELPIYISRYRGRPAMYYWFYTRTNPQAVQAVESSSTQDQGEFLEYGQLHFVNNIPQLELPAGGIVIGSAEEIHQLVVKFTQQTYTEVGSIIDPLDKIIWQIIQVSPQF